MGLITPPPENAALSHQVGLLSLIGHLNHAATVVKPGHTFIRSLIDASSSVKSLDHHIHLSPAARADISWWSTFIRSWNGISLLPPPSPSQHIYTDASCSWGCRALCGQKWFQVPWPFEWSEVNIAHKEIVPILLAVACWGPSWRGERILYHSDNAAVVYAINKGSACDPQLMHILHSLFFLWRSLQCFDNCQPHPWGS